MFRKTITNLKDLAKADVITAFLEETGVEYLLYGRDALKRVRNARRLLERTGQPQKHLKLSVLRICVRDADEMDELTYAVEMMKTYACLN